MFFPAGDVSGGGEWQPASAGGENFPLTDFLSGEHAIWLQTEFDMIPR